MLEEIIAERKKKLDKLKNAGIDPYPVATPKTTPVSEVVSSFAKLAKLKKQVSIAGRVIAFRDIGNIMFLRLRDMSGEMQVVVKKDSNKNFKLWKDSLDRGDFIFAKGLLFVTKTKEKSIEAKDIIMLSKSLRALPSDWFGVADEDARLRERYVDLILNEESRELFKKKNAFWRSIRDFMIAQDFMEVETGVLEAIPGGAEAEPFVTHHNALDANFYLRISLELPLKKLVVGGYERVFEIGRIFRNEGISREHLQDYTQMEFYWAYRDYRDLMKILPKMYRGAVKATTGGKLITTHQGRKIDWGKEWKTVDYCQVFKKENKLDPLSASLDELRARAQEVGAEPEKNDGRGRLIDLIYKKTVRPNLVQPCFLINPPVEIEPLAKRSPIDARVVERLQIVACGTELGKGFTELNDPLDQRGRFEEQQRLRDSGDKEAQFMDEDFLGALEYGMPPTAGFGMSERLFAVLLDKPIRECVFFPLMRNK
jgi:lysyl-tRNA synthetase, class II